VIRLAVRARREDAELVLAELLELAPGGVEELEIGAETVEYAVYGAPGELPELPDLNAAVGGRPVEVSSTEIAEDWSERWKRFHRPVLIEPPRGSSVPALHVRPPWESASDRDGAEEIVIDPGQAFGTGAHATTRLCLELLLELAALDDRGTGSASDGAEAPRRPLLDVGTGSGVLAITAARLGFAPVLGLDHERESVAATEENARVNGVAIEVRRFDLRTQALPWPDPGGEGGWAAEGNAAEGGGVDVRAAGVRRADGRAVDGSTADARAVAAGAGSSSLVIVANLLRPLLLDLARAMDRAPAHLLAGGLLREQVDEVVEAFGESLGMRERERRERGEWAVVWLTSSPA
jgi:ribosomal protein L11 methyltransferase